MTEEQNGSCIVGWQWSFSKIPEGKFAVSGIPPKGWTDEEAAEDLREAGFEIKEKIDGRFHVILVRPDLNEEEAMKLDQIREAASIYLSEMAL